MKMRTAEAIKMKGQSLKGRKFTLKPVNKDIRANTINPNADNR